MSYYHQILEIPVGSSPAEIKKAFRTLSKKYHPDINSSPDAQQKFMEVHEAYKFLTLNPSWTGPRPSSSSSGSGSKRPSKEEMQQKRAQQYARKKAQEANRRERENVRKIVRGMKTVSYVVMVVAALVTVDYLLPRTEKKVDIIDFEYSTYYRQGVFNVTEGTNQWFRIDYKIYLQMQDGETDPIILHTTPILGFMKKAEIELTKEDGSLKREPLWSNRWSSYTARMILSPIVILILLFNLFFVQLADKKLSWYIFGFFIALMMFVSMVY